MMEASDTALVHGRRHFLLRGCLLSGSVAAVGIAIVLNDDKYNLLGYLIAVLFGLFTVLWAAYLLLPTEDLLELPSSFFQWIALSELEMRDRPIGARDGAKSPPAIPEPISSAVGMWDRELDGNL